MDEYGKGPVESSIYDGDCTTIMQAWSAESIDAIVTDPPYFLGFMDKDFDCQEGADSDPQIAYRQHTIWAREAFRVLKPGGHILAFGGTRTYHRLACALEDVGFEIRDCIMWLYGSGFPKSLDVSKAIDKAARGCPQGGPDPASAGHGKYKSGCSDDNPAGRGFGAGPGAFMREQVSDHPRATPETEDAKRWQGWGTALKPAHEPIVVARKPLDGTVAENVLRHGTGAINIDGCRVPTADGLNGGAYSGGTRPRSAMGLTGTAGGTGSMVEAGGGRLPPEAFKQPTGRWPTNLVLSHHPDCRQVGMKRVRGNVCSNKSTECARVWSEGGNWKRRIISDHADEEGMEMVPEFECVDGCPVKELGEQSGECKAGGVVGGAESSIPGTNTYGVYRRVPNTPHDDTGTAARFFPTFRYEPKASKEERNLGLEDDHNRHPTVKPLDLMRWLVRLVTPPKGIVLDPFLGSGTTAMAAILEGKDWIGIEREAEYVEIAKARIEWAEDHVKRFGLLPIDMGTTDAVERRESDDDKNQTSLF